MLRRSLLAFLPAAGIIIIDQITKYIVRTTLALGETADFIPWFIRFRYIQNRGASFGMLTEHRWVFLVLSTVAIAALIYILVKYSGRHPLLTLSLSFLLGGGVGNMIDRLFFVNSAGENVVIDFFEFTFVNFAVFNVADMFITFGAILLGVYVVFFETKAMKKASDTKEDGND